MKFAELGLMRYGGAGGGVSPTYLPASTFNSLGNWMTTAGDATKSEVVCIDQHYLGGGDAASLALSFSNWQLGQNSSQGAILPARRIKFTRIFVNHPTAGWVQVTKGGQTQFIIEIGANNELSDPFYLADFSGNPGSGVFTEGTGFILKYAYTPVDGSGTIVGGGQVASGPFEWPSGGFPGLTNTPGTIPDSHLQTYGNLGFYGGSGGNYSTHPVINLMAVYDGDVPPINMVFGDSITAGTGDTAKSYAILGMVDDIASPTVFRSGIVMARGGASASVLDSGAPNDMNGKFKEWAALCNVWHDHMGANGGGSISSRRSAAADFIASSNTGHDPVAVAFATGPNCTSTDSFVTLANQTPVWEVGDFAYDNNATMAGLVGTEYDYYFDPTDYRGGTDPDVIDYWKWSVTDGLARTVGGLHPNTLCDQEKAVQWRTLLGTIAAAW